MIQIAVVNEPSLLLKTFIPNQMMKKLKQELLKENSKTKVYCCLITLLFYFNSIFYLKGF
jgi:hypothetical protein